METLVACLIGLIFARLAYLGWRAWWDDDENYRDPWPNRDE